MIIFTIRYILNLQIADMEFSGAQYFNFVSISGVRNFALANAYCEYSGINKQGYYSGGGRNMQNTYVHIIQDLIPVHFPPFLNSTKFATVLRDTRIEFYIYYS